MLAEVDAESGSVRLDDEGLSALLEGQPPTALDSERLAPALAALRQPTVALELVVGGSAARLAHRIGVSPDAAALLLGVRPGLHQLSVVPPSYVASALVRLTRLRPRPTAERSARAFSADRQEELTHEDPARRTAALAEAGADHAWRLVVARAGDHRSITAVDGQAGLFLAEGDTLLPITNTTAYRIFSTVLGAEAG